MLDIQRNASINNNHGFQEIARRKPRIVGFSTTFQQTNASLLLATLLKVHRPETVIVFGGANCEGDMGRALLANNECIDFVFSGPSDESFPRFASDVIRRGGVTPDVPFISSYNQQSLDELPYPDFVDFFAQLSAFDLDDKVNPGLIMEASRGCFWGEVSHCKFCGVNGLSMPYLRKSPDRLLDEIHYLSRRYDLRRIEFVDNVLFPGYASTVFRTLSGEQDTYEFFFEILPHLGHERLRQLRAGGLSWVQAGIETLDDGLLQRMGKSGSVLKRLEFLKHCRELDVKVDWNFLYGIPGENGLAYEEMQRWADRIVHLPPPAGAVQVRPERFSPYHEDAEAREFMPIRPVPAYQYVFDCAPQFGSNLAYYFEFARPDPETPVRLAKGMLDQIDRWRDAHTKSPKPTLEFAVTSGPMAIVDSRNSRDCELELSDEMEFILENTREVRSTAQLVIKYAARCDPEWMPFHQALQWLKDTGLVINQNEQVLSLVFGRASYTASGKLFPGGQLSSAPHYD